MPTKCRVVRKRRREDVAFAWAGWVGRELRRVRTSIRLLDGVEGLTNLPWRENASGAHRRTLKHDTLEFFHSISRGKGSSEGAGEGFPGFLLLAPEGDSRRETGH